MLPPKLYIFTCPFCTFSLDIYKETKQIDFFERFIGVEEYTNEMMKALIKAIYIYDDKRVEIKWNFNDTNSSFFQVQMTL